MGLDPWHSRVRLWCEKTGRLEAREDSEAAAWGRALEPLIVTELERRGDYRVEPGATELRDERRPWMIGHPDGYVTTGRTLGLLEVKTAGMRQERAWHEGAVPAGYVLQAQHYLALSDLPFCLIACLLGGQELVLRLVERDRPMIAQLVELEREFWRFVERDEPPPPDGDAASDEALRLLYPQAAAGAVVQLGAADRELLREHEALTAALDATTRQRDAVKQRLQLRMGAAEIALLDGEPVARWSNVHARRLNTKRLQTEAPHVARQFTDESSYRRFQVVA